MADIKQIHVTLTPQDEKSFSRTVKGTRKRKEQKPLEEMPTMEPKQVDHSSTKVEQPSPKVEQSSAKVNVLPTKKVAESKKADDTKKVEALKKADDPKKVEVTKKPDEKVPDQPLITIHAKKFSVTEKKPNIHKILPSKKHLSAAPSALSLKKKLKLVIGTPLKKLEGGAPSKPDPFLGGESAPKKKQTFKERKISIELQANSVTRKQKRTLKNLVRSMPLFQVKKALLAKGILTPKKGQFPPEEILRSMLQDYMSLHTME